MPVLHATLLEGKHPINRVSRCACVLESFQLHNACWTCQRLEDRKGSSSPAQLPSSFGGWTTKRNVNGLPGFPGKCVLQASAWHFGGYIGIHACLSLSELCLETDHESAVGEVGERSAQGLDLSWSSAPSLFVSSFYLDVFL